MLVQRIPASGWGGGEGSVNLWQEVIGSLDANLNSQQVMNPLSCGHLVFTASGL
jgi:hypothetical protein